MTILIASGEGGGGWRLFWGGREIFLCCKPYYTFKILNCGAYSKIRDRFEKNLQRVNISLPKQRKAYQNLKKIIRILFDPAMLNTRNYPQRNSHEIHSGQVFRGGYRDAGTPEGTGRVQMPGLDNSTADPSSSR